ncbi:MAG: SNARE associated Golgi protein [Hydrogenophilales bacterium 28-61-23]|nr:MAG: SNARE associated Golgi protein [Hydrogenophilales bacterium 28-61-23]
MTWQVLLKGLLMLASLALLGFLASHFQFDGMLSQHWIDSEIRGKGWTGDLLFLAVGGLATALSFPRQVVAFLGGYAFDFFSGTVLSTLATLLGCVLGFFYARWLGRGFVQKRFPGRIRKLDAFLHQHPFSMTLVVRLLPVGSNAATNLLAGVSSVRALPFFAGSVLGYLPQNLVFALAGSGVNLDPTMRLSLAVALFVVSSLVGIWLYRRYRQSLAGVAEANDQARDPQ